MPASIQRAPILLVQSAAGPDASESGSLSSHATTDPAEPAAAPTKRQQKQQAATAAALMRLMAQFGFVGLPPIAAAPRRSPATAEGAATQRRGGAGRLASTGQWLASLLPERMRYAAAQGASDTSSGGDDSEDDSEEEAADGADADTAGPGPSFAADRPVRRAPAASVAGDPASPSSVAASLPADRRRSMRAPAAPDGQTQTLRRQSFPSPLPAPISVAAGGAAMLPTLSPIHHPSSGGQSSGAGPSPPAPASSSSSPGGLRAPKQRSRRDRTGSSTSSAAQLEADPDAAAVDDDALLGRLLDRLAAAGYVTPEGMDALFAARTHPGHTGYHTAAGRPVSAAFSSAAFGTPGGTFPAGGTRSAGRGVHRGVGVGAALGRDVAMGSRDRSVSDMHPHEIEQLRQYQQAGAFETGWGQPAPSNLSFWSHAGRADPAFPRRAPSHPFYHRDAPRDERDRARMQRPPLAEDAEDDVDDAGEAELNGEDIDACGLETSPGADGTVDATMDGGAEDDARDAVERLYAHAKVLRKRYARPAMPSIGASGTATPGTTGDS
jgi:hypothetical protein